ncbi:hypothetical protein COV16_01520 [Candidatus Woesearchaeota archaeon CG10_big_fil_rev_8_21_14_0_10_34_8]|nr:MAG: hypothetical protein COV16_01520 [Candidatus Woesearchaeota archaeon CG10_big_fil_rev_8_21_14_0_10_34_8]
MLTKSLGIHKGMHKTHIEDKEGYLDLREPELDESNTIELSEIAESRRIGVKKDLPRNLRFYIKGNKCVSR